MVADNSADKEMKIPSSTPGTKSDEYHWSFWRVLLPAAGAADSPDHWAGELDEADEEAEDETSAEDEDGDGRDREAVLDPDEVRVVIREGPPIDEL